MTVTFNGPLQSLPTALGNWVLHLVPSGTVGPTVTNVSGSQVQLTFAGTPGTNAESIQYLATPPDLVGTNGANVAPFDLSFA